MYQGSILSLPQSAHYILEDGVLEVSCLLSYLGLKLLLPKQVVSDVAVILSVCTAIQEVDWSLEGEWDIGDITATATSPFSFVLSPHSAIPILPPSYWLSGARLCDGSAGRPVSSLLEWWSNSSQQQVTFVLEHGLRWHTGSIDQAWNCVVSVSTQPV